MKKYFYYFIAVIILSACGDSGKIRVKEIPESKYESITSVIWQKADSGRFYYDLRATESYFTFLDDKSDTIIRIYKRDNPHELYNYFVTKERNILDNKFQFLKTNTRNSTNENQLWIIENNISIRTINPENSAEELLSAPASFPFKNLPLSVDFNLTKDEILAAPLSDSYRYNSPYYLYHPDSGYIRAEIHKHPDIKYPKVSLAYLTCLTVSEEANSAVSAQRFMNDVLFYDLRGNLRSVATFGKGHIIPEIKDKTVDMDNSTKFFIYIFGTKKYVYCLYDGTTDYTANSKIIVFDWQGKHIKTYQADRCLKQIVVNETDTEIIALAANEQYGRDVVRYQVK